MRWVLCLGLSAALCGCVESPPLERAAEGAPDAASLWEGDGGPSRPSQEPIQEPAADSGSPPEPVVRWLDASVAAGGASGTRGGAGGASGRAAAGASAGSGASRAPSGGAGEGIPQPSAADAVPRPARASALLITEIMIDPKARSDAEGEWFELWNPGQVELDVYGCALGDGAAQVHVFETHVRVAPGAFVAIARGDQPGFVPALAINFSLKNDSDVLEVICDGVSIDRVAYDRSQGFPVAAGSAMSLDTAHASADGNDLPAAWCLATQPYGAADRGTPAQPNPPCAGAADDAGRPE